MFSLRTLLRLFLVPSKVTRTRIGAFSLVCIYLLIRSFRYIGSCCSTQYFKFVKQDLVHRSETYRKPVQLEHNWCYMFPFCESVSPDVQHSSALAVGDLSERERERERERQTDRQTDRHTYIQTDRQTDREGGVIT